MKKTALFIFLALSTLAIAQVSDLDREDQHVASSVGGKREFKRLFEQELVYPDSSLNTKTGGKVELTFQVKADSTVDRVKVSRSVNKEIDREALRIFKMMKWVPAFDIGRPTETETYLTFNFQPNKYKEICKNRGYTKPEYPSKLPVDSSMKIYQKVDQNPEYINGNQNLGEFVQKNLQYPEEVKSRGIAGQVILSFVVEPTGLMSNISITKSIGAGCDQEAERVLELIKWKPGAKKGRVVRTQMTMPFNFQLSQNYR